MSPIFSFLLLATSLGPIGTDAPAREPQMAVRGSMVALTFGAGREIYFSASHDAGATFSKPVKVAAAAIVPLTRHRGPQIALSGSAIVITAVVGNTAAEGAHAHGLPSDGDLFCWRSTDGGKSWSKGVLVNDVPASPTEGLHSLASDTKGNLFAAWLDHRGGHGTKLFGARSTDGGLSWSKNSLIYESADGTVCECCRPSATIDASGQILVMWRNWLDGSRDMYLARSNGGTKFSAPEKLGTGTWKLNACPMDGGGIAVSQGRVITAWRREHDLFLGIPGEKEIDIGAGVDIAVAGAPDGALVIWTTPSGVMALLPGRKGPIEVAPKGSSPSITALPNGRVLAAWEDDGKIIVQPVL